MEEYPTFGEVSPDYGEIEDYKESYHYITSQLSKVESTSDLCNAEVSSDLDLI